MLAAAIIIYGLSSKKNNRYIRDETNYVEIFFLGIFAFAYLVDSL